ncbi:MAG: helix-turn-helix transcriptional regulator, partial [Halobaculum sp.]
PTASPTPTPTPGDGNDAAAFGAVIVVVALAVVTLVAYQGGLAGGLAVPEPNTNGGPGDGGAVAEQAVEPEPEPADEAEPDDEEEPDSEEEEPEPSPDPELLSDEERVEHLLEQNGGRMRQADIVTETGWSDAKVSQLLSSMAEEDRVDKLRLGRENLISFPDTDDLPSRDEE